MKAATVGGGRVLNRRPRLTGGHPRGTVTGDTLAPIPGGITLNLQPEVEQELSEFLMYELASTYEDFDNDSVFTLSVMTNIAVLGDSINESLLEMYLSPVKELVNQDIVYGTAAYFHAAEILSIDCDCEGYNPVCLARTSDESDWARLALEHKADNTGPYKFAMTNVESLRAALA